MSWPSVSWTKLLPELALITSQASLRSIPPRLASMSASPSATRWMNASMLVITLITDARRLERGHALLRGERREALQLMQVVRAHVDPGATGGEAREDAVLAGDGARDDLRGGQAGDDGIRPARRLRR